jgi:predicted transposase/invertase (TIGR01784 family)
MGQTLLLPTNDFVFKKIFGESSFILSNFLQAILDLPDEEYKGLTVDNPNLEREYLDDKLGVLDVKVHTKSGKVIDVEVQVKAQRAIWERMTFYTAKMVVEQVKSGYKYEHINRVISILIADFIMIKENTAYHNRFRLYDERTKARFPDSIEINVLEIPKLREADGTPLGDWMRFFSAETEEDFMQAAQTNPAIAEAWGVIKVLSGDERARALAEAREKARMDLDSWLSDAQLEGEERGVQRGRQEVAQKLLRKKMPLADIADATGLSLDAVKRISADFM